MENPRGFDVNLAYPAQAREYEHIADRVAAEAADRPAGPVLDWGCGWGQVTALLAERDLEVRSFDYAGPGAPEAEVPLERFPERTAFLSAEPVRLPYADGTFSAVLSCGVLEHVASPGGSLAELHRVLRPGGMLHVHKLPNRTSYLELVARRSGRMYFHGQLEHDTIWTERAAERMVAAHGFAVREVGLANMLPLTAGGELAKRHGDLVWSASRALSRVPGLRQLATNVEVIARRP